MLTFLLDVCLAEVVRLVTVGDRLCSAPLSAPVCTALLCSAAGEWEDRRVMRVVEYLDLKAQALSFQLNRLPPQRRLELTGGVKAGLYPDLS